MYEYENINYLKFNQGTVVLGKNARHCFVHSFRGRKIESRRQLRRERNQQEKIKIGNEKGKKKARPRTTSDARARSKYSEDSIPSF